MKTYFIGVYTFIRFFKLELNEVPEDELFTNVQTDYQQYMRLRSSHGSHYSAVF